MTCISVASDDEKVRAIVQEELADLQALFFTLQAHVDSIEARCTLQMDRFEETGQDALGSEGQGQITLTVPDYSVAHAVGIMEGRQLSPSEESAGAQDYNSARTLPMQPHPAAIGIDACKDSTLSCQTPDGTECRASAAALTSRSKGNIMSININEDTEDWDFGLDSYSVGLVALAKYSLPKALPHLGVAFLAPLLQLCCYYFLLHFMIAETPYEPQHGSVHIMVSCICFFLLGLQLINEMMLGAQKMIFSFRWASGKYVDLSRRFSVLGLALSFEQLALPLYIVGLSMNLVLNAETMLTACMNYAAILFITEIDNYLIDNYSVSQFLIRDCTIHVRHASATAATGREPLPMVAMLLLNAFTILATIHNVLLQLWIGRTDLEWWCKQLPSFCVTLVAWNLVLGLGSRWVQPIKLAVPSAVLAISSNILLYSLAFSGILEWAPPLVIHANLIFTGKGVFAAASMMLDPTPLLACPFSIPFVCWLSLIACSLWTAHMNIFGMG